MPIFAMSFNLVGSQLPPALTPLSLPETVLAAVLGAVIILAGLGVAFSRKAVHAAIYMIAVMVALSMIYFQLGAQFLGAAQIVVYTGAIMMLFLFVIMLVGVQAVDSPRETRGYLVGASLLLTAALAIIMGLGVYSSSTLTLGVLPGELSADNPKDLALALFTNYYFALEAVATLLVIAALGAMALTHSDKLLPQITQSMVVDFKMDAYKNAGRHPGQNAGPGVYAESNALDVPAISGETGAPLPQSVPQVMRVRSQMRSLGETTPWTARQLMAQAQGATGLHGAAASQSVSTSQAWGMPGPASAIDAVAELETKDRLSVQTSKKAQINAEATDTQAPEGGQA